MKKNVTYLFGAGASANALPVVKYFNARLELFLDFLKYHKRISDKFNDFIPEVEFILKEAKNHSTIDTVAKKYFHSYKSNSYNMVKLKRVLIIFFLFEQKTFTTYTDINPYNTEEFQKKFGFKQGNIDIRYDSFIAALLEPKENQFKLPEHVSIITWNYDCQFELAFQQFQNLNMYDLQKQLGIYPFMDKQFEKSFWREIDDNKFRIFHLNGKAHNFVRDDVNSPIISNFDRQDNLENIIEKSLQNIRINELTFAWERFSKVGLQQNEIQDVINSAESTVERSQILVIIGYSFPFFNRDIDKKLFREKSFEKIYIQDLDADEIKELFINVIQPEIHPNNIKAQKNITQFLLPPELDTDYAEPSQNLLSFS